MDPMTRAGNTTEVKVIRTTVRVVKKTNRPALPIHNLQKLAEIADLKPNPKQVEQFREITKFNLEARYDDYKLRFYKKATSEFAHKWFTVTIQLLAWLKTN